MTSEGLKDISLHDYKDKKSVVLAFYVFAFTGGLNRGDEELPEEREGSGSF